MPELIDTLSNILGDLREVLTEVRKGPLSPFDREHQARILDRLAQEVAEAAAMLRST